MIYKDVAVIFGARFWKNERLDLRGVVHDTIVHEQTPGQLYRVPEVEVLLQVPLKKDQTKLRFERTEILISQDPHADLSTKAGQNLSKNNLRQALRDTYGDEVDEMTLDQLAAASRQQFDHDFGVPHSAANQPQ